MGYYDRDYRAPSRFLSPRLIMALLLAAFTVVSYMMKSQVNPVTGEKQRISISPRQEIMLGLQAVNQMAMQHGGASRDAQASARVSEIGHRIVSNSDARKSPYQFEFHLLADSETINAFALPGGQVFMTEGLYRKLPTSGQVAGVLAHEIGHVVGRHGAEHLAKQELTQGLTGAAVLATYDPNRPGTQNAALIAAAVGQLVNMKYGREDESESDNFGVSYMVQAGYDPNSMLRVMEVLRDAAKDPDNRNSSARIRIRRIALSGSLRASRSCSLRDCPQDWSRRAHPKESDWSDRSDKSDESGCRLTLPCVLSHPEIGLLLVAPEAFQFAQA